MACLTIWSAGRLNAASLLETMDSEVSSLYQQSKNAIVKVHAQRTLATNSLVFGPPHRIGTGFFIDGAGHLLTAATVVGDTTNCWIEWDNLSIPAKVLGSDPDVNLSVLQVDPEKCIGPGHQMPFLVQGNSDDLKVGSLVIAIGFPRDLPSTPVVGFVGGFDIKGGALAFLTSHFRAGCRLSPGQGGGPLLNPRGEVVGIAVAAHGDDQCYALPINAAKKVVADILQDGRAQHGWVGLGVADQQAVSTLPRASRWQVFIQQVYSNSPAAAAGFRDHDIVLKICTNDIEHSADVLDAMFLHRCGEQIQFTVLRDGGTQEVTAVIGQRPITAALAPQPLPQLPGPQPRPPTLIIVPASASRP